ncbi:MAG: SDR family oxidoreductase [Gemmatimonas sp.]
MTLALEGRTAIITGANQGLGLEIARAYVRAGASVLLCARDELKLHEAQNELQAFASSDQIVGSIAADVSVEADVQRVVARALELFSQLHVLVNNAGVYGPMGTIENIDWQLWMRAIEINLYGSVLMARAVLSQMRSQQYGKIVQLSGGGATSPMPGISAYAASKAAVVRFAETLAEETRDARIDVNAIAPGALNTRMLDEVILAGPERVGKSYYERSLQQQEQGGASMSKAAALAVYLGSAESDGITGKLLSAVWDPWEEMQEHKPDLTSDVYTLRRIVPRDRGLTWGDQ